MWRTETDAAMSLDCCTWRNVLMNGSKVRRVAEVDGDDAAIAGDVVG